MDGTLWVFGYGSLMWNPGFVHLRAEKAVLHGAHRALCIYSTHYRGTPDKPGLVFGLKAGGSCVGMAFEVAAADREAVIAYLRAREQISMVYREEMRPVRLASDGRTVRALAYIAEPGHSQYAGALSAERVHAIVTTSRGEAGPNSDYVLSTVEHLAALGINDRPLSQLAAGLRQPVRSP
jgi:cation transport protein ChaC